MKKVIVTTTINPPTEAIKRFVKKEEWDLVIIGDKKTPKDYHVDRGLYVTPEMQESYDKELSDAIGWNCIQRRNFGLLYAYDMKADIVALVDDDNIPCDQWGNDVKIGKKVRVTQYQTELPAFDPIGATNSPQLWHRGFPLQLLSKRSYAQHKEVQIVPDIQADFWNGDPDIDAICRMEHAPECMFDTSYFPLAGDKLAPFNSQNTFISAKILKDYFLFPHVGRMDDIWAAYYVQAKGFNVIFDKPSVYQSRNVHNLTKDMKAEYLGYEHNLEIVENLPGNPDMIRKFLPEESIRAFELYQKHFK
jgi:hypothetical protein